MDQLYSTLFKTDNLALILALIVVIVLSRQYAVLQTEVRSLSGRLETYALRVGTLEGRFEKEEEIKEVRVLIFQKLDSIEKKLKV